MLSQEKSTDLEGDQASTRNVLSSKDENIQKANAKVFERLYQEKIRNQSPHGATTSTKTLREQEELKECTFKPAISEASQIMARNQRNKQVAIEDELDGDAKHRRMYRLDLKQTVR